MISNRFSPTRASLIAVLATFLLATSASAGIVIQADNNNVVSVPGITGFSTSAADMLGMEVTAHFSAGDVETQSWAALGGGMFGVAGTTGNGGAGTGFWSLTETGDTYSTNMDNWTLTTRNSENELTSLVINGLAGGVVFDRTHGGAEGTPFSALGLDFFSSLADPMGTDLGNITVTYSDLIQIGANAPVGDLYGMLRIDFSFPNPFGPGLPDVGLVSGVNNGVFTFRADTDTVGLPPGTVPEPGTLLLLGAGLVSVWYGRRQNG